MISVVCSLTRNPPSLHRGSFRKFLSPFSEPDKTGQVEELWGLLETRQFRVKNDSVKLFWIRAFNVEPIMVG